MREETFGPVSPIIRFATSTRRSASPTAPRTACRRRSARTGSTTSRASSPSCDVGTVNVREVPGYRLELTPFGGIKDSGLGYKEGVQEAMKSFTNLKTYSLPVELTSFAGVDALAPQPARQRSPCSSGARTSCAPACCACSARTCAASSRRASSTASARWLAGLGVTSLVQSSTATCLIVASFVGKNLVDDERRARGDARRRRRHER